MNTINKKLKNIDMKKYIIIAVGMLLTIGASAQQDPHFTMYMFNKQVLNPAYVGSREVTSATALYRNQWAGWGDGKPTTINAGINSPIDGKTDYKRVALGIFAFNDNIGVSNTFGLYGQYAYRMPLDDDASTILSLGLQAGFVNYRNMLTELNPIDPGDQLLQEDIVNSFMPNIGMGAYLYSDKFYVGLSIPRLVQNQYDKEEIPTGNDLVAKQYRHFFGMAGYVFTLTDNVKIKPNVMAKYVGLFTSRIDAPFDADFNVTFYFMDRFGIGASYRLEDSFDAILEMQITKNLRAGYSYDYTTSEIGGFEKGSHEIMIGYDFGEKIKSFTTPRFIKYF